jgi:hypothetical protein
MRSLIFFGVLVVTAIGVWVGMRTAGTTAAPRIELVMGVLMMAAGTSIFFGEDPRDRRLSRLMGAGFTLNGASFLLPSGPWRIGVGLTALTLMLTSVLLRRRMSRARPS